MQRNQLLVLTLLMWMGLAIFAFSVPIPTMTWALVVLGLQQMVLILGGLKGLPSWEVLRVRWTDLWRGIVAGCGLFCANIAVSAGIIVLFSLLFGTEQTLERLLQERQGVQTLIDYARHNNIWLVTAFVVVGAPLSEELFFRGFLLESLRERVCDKTAIFLSALCFAAFHFYVIQFMPVLVSGLVLGLVYIRSGSLTRTIVAHAIVNALVLVIAVYF